MDETKSVNCSQVVFDVQLTRRRILADLDFPLWSAELKEKARAAELRLRAISGNDLVKAMIEYGRATGQRVKV